jgi:hypothetical protein
MGGTLVKYKPTRCYVDHVQKILELSYVQDYAAIIKYCALEDNLWKYHWALNHLTEIGRLDCENKEHVDCCTVYIVQVQKKHNLVLCGVSSDNRHIAHCCKLLLMEDYIGIFDYARCADSEWTNHKSLNILCKTCKQQNEMFVIMNDFVKSLI